MKKVRNFYICILKLLCSWGFYLFKDVLIKTRATYKSYNYQINESECNSHRDNDLKTVNEQFVYLFKKRITKTNSGF